MTNAILTTHNICQSRTLVCTAQPIGPLERALARLLMAAYKRRLRGTAEVAPA